MSVIDKLTKLANAVRSDRMINNKLSVDEMTNLLSNRNELVKGLGDSPYVEGVKITKESDGYTLAADFENARIALNFVDQSQLKGKTVAIYFQASTNAASEVPIYLGPIGANLAYLTVKGEMTGYYTVLTFTANNSLSIIFNEAASINIRNLRAWIAS